MPTGVSRAWYKRPFLMAALIMGVVFLLFFSSIVYQAIKFYPLIKSGQDPAKIAREQKYRAALSNLFEGSIVTAEDRGKLENGDFPTFGNPQAPVKIVEFIDWDCKFCKSAAPTVRALAEKRPNDVYLIFRDFPSAELHPRAEKAALAARCVYKQNDLPRFWRFHDLMFTTQGSRTDEDLNRFASQVGADMAKFQTCYSSNQESEAVQKSIQDGASLGVRGTPTFFFNGVKIQGDLDLESLNMVVDQALKTASQ